MEHPGRLRRPVTDAGGARSRAPVGRREFCLQDGSFGGWLHLPPQPPARLVLVLHGAGGSAEDMLRLLRPCADRNGVALYAPHSAGVTWDLVESGYGEDVRRLQEALDRVGGTLPAGDRPYTIAGFSDGASYALSLGLANGDLFDAVLAFSPGFTAAGERHGRPGVFISHGRDDQILPVERCGRRLARTLAGEGYAVSYREFDGGHRVPDRVLDEAFAWLATGACPG